MSMSHKSTNHHCMKTLRAGSSRRRRGASLIHILAITGACATLSAIVFPKFATPDEKAQVGVMETAASMSSTQIESDYRDSASRLMRGHFFSLRHGHGENVAASFHIPGDLPSKAAAPAPREPFAPAGRA